MDLNERPSRRGNLSMKCIQYFRPVPLKRQIYFTSQWRLVPWSSKHHKMRGSIQEFFALITPQIPNMNSTQLIRNEAYDFVASDRLPIKIDSPLLYKLRDPHHLVFHGIRRNNWDFRLR